MAQEKEPGHPHPFGKLIAGPRFDRWIEAIIESGAFVYAKRLSGNDTGLTEAHQAGLYLPKPFAFRVIPEIHRPERQNPDLRFPLRIESHGDEREVRAIWYNSRTRNETRLTRFGGASSPLLRPENTGALTLLAFTRTAPGPACSVWLCTTVEDEERAEAYIGPVEPGAGVEWDPSAGAVTRISAPDAAPACRLAHDQIPGEWLVRFPSGAEIVRKTLELLPAAGWDPDERLIRRRDCEFEVFLSVEEVTVLPLVKPGFDSVSDFVEQAQTVLQRRKSRAGRSLELQLKAILSEEGLVEGRDFEYNVESDHGKRPDFLFPSQQAYRDARFPSERLDMLATKTTCRDRWRQVLNEADRIPTKHLLTLQEGVTEQQFREMRVGGVRLVVPTQLQRKYPSTIRDDLISVREFIAGLGTSRPLSA